MRIFFINNELSIQVRQFYLLGQVIITLTMNTNDKGLRISADIIDTNNGTDVYKLIKRGDLNKMSFAFTVKSERTEVDKENKIYTRTITAFDKIYDVAVVDFPAYDGTSIQARSKEY